MGLKPPHRLNGYDSCIMGLTERPGTDQVIVYNLEAVLQKLRKEFNTDRAGAVRHLDDMVRGVAPELMPTFLTYASIKQIDEIYK